MKIKKECIVCGYIIEQEESYIQGCCGFSMFPKHDVDMFRQAGWRKQ